MFLILHLRGPGIVDFDSLTKILPQYETLYSHLLFYSNSTELNDRIRALFPKVRITRSTASQVENCLKHGLTDPEIFRSDCQQADLWIPYSLFATKETRARTEALVDKVRDHENTGALNHSVIAIDHVNDKQAACDVILNLAGPTYNGFITDNPGEVAKYYTDPSPCLWSK